MKTLHKYLLRDFLVILGMSLFVITMVMYLAAIMRGLDYVARGLPGLVLVQVFTLNIPYILSFSIPISCIIASLLLFGRLSGDGEFTAMRSGGLSTWQIVSPVVFCGAVLTLVCLMIHYEIAPESRYARRQALVNVDAVNPLDLLDEGRFVRFPKMEIYVSEKEDTLLQDVEVVELDRNQEIVQTIRAREGEVFLNELDKYMRVKLFNVQVQHPDSEDETNLTRSTIIDMDTYEFDISYRELMEKNQVSRGIKDMRGRQLIQTIGNVENHFPNLDPVRREKTRMKALVEAQKRIGLSFACLAFTLIGIPLGMNNKRSESNRGIIIGISMIIVFYAFIETASGLRYRPWLLPDYIIWLPVIVSQVVGAWMIKRLP